MEPRTLLAANPLAATSSFSAVSSGNDVTVVTVSPANKDLFVALQTFLRDLESAFGPNGTGTNDAVRLSLQSDLAQIASLSGLNNRSNVASLSGDVTSIVNAGAITPTQRLAVLSDLEAIALNAGVPGSVVISAANGVLGINGTGTKLDELSVDLADPNAIGTAQAGQTRGQSDSSSPSLIAPGASLGGSALPGSGPLGLGFRRLLDDLKAALAGSQAVTPAQKAAVGKDFAEITAVAHRPEVQTVSTLKDDLDRIQQAGKITDDGRATIGRDFQGMLQSAGVPDVLINRSIGDFQPILNAADLDPTALKTVLGDLANVLSARPKSSSPFGGWWLGGPPR